MTKVYSDMFRSDSIIILVKHCLLKSRINIKLFKCFIPDTIPDEELFLYSGGGGGSPQSQIKER